MNRTLAQLIAISSFVVPLLSAAPLDAAEQQPDVAGRQPNVIVIYTDDQGSIDAGCYGADDIETPAVDALAARGVRFTQFYSPASVCSPSRAGMLTGRYPWQIGMPGNAGATVSEDVNDLSLVDEPAKEFAAETTMAEMFKEAGYATAHIGKWHLNYGPGSKPLDQGFDYSFGHLNGCIDNYSHFVYWNGTNRHDLWENNQRVRMPGQFFPDLMVDKAEGFIAKHQDKPFFMYFAMNMPHYPYQGDAKWLKKYDHLPFPRNLYAAFVSTLDERVASLLSTIDKSGLTNDTIVIYQSDNGHSVEERAHFGGGSNGPYRGAKFSLFEGGIRLPAIISWPGHLPAGQVRDQVAHGCDWLPTVAELCRVKTPTVTLAGKSLVPVIESASAPTPHEVLHWQQGKQWAVREGDWKLICNVRNDSDDGLPLSKQDLSLFLSNIAKDPGETTNLAAEQPGIVERLTSLHEQAAH